MTLPFNLIEPALTLLGIEITDGLQLLDGSSLAGMYHPPINPDFPALIGNVHSRQTASELQRVLLNQYPGDFPASLVHNPGTAGAQVESLPLSEIDESALIDSATLLFVPPLGEMSSFEQFQEVIAHLRSPEGCPWDRKQTHMSLRQYLLEEAYEVLEAIDQDDPKALAEELGDLMLQIVLHTQIAIDDGEFYMTDVMRHVNQKMIRRHPHVWSTATVTDAEEVVLNWQAIKQQEKAENGNGDQSLLDSIPKTLPALMLALEYQARAAKVGFDWDEIGDVRAKINEELDEALAATTAEERADEIGDVLFVMVNWARWLKIDPESALRDTSAKFYRRFSFIEQRVRETGKQMTDYPLAQLDAFWDEAKDNGL
jgi:tetrapyrrole methylase family protein/MazG family protein